MCTRLERKQCVRCKKRTDGHGTLQMVLAVKALVMDIPMPHSFLHHQIVCDVVNESKQLTKAERV